MRWTAHARTLALAVRSTVVGIACLGLARVTEAGDLSGTYTQDQTLTTSGSPWTVTGSVVFEGGAVLTVEAGVVLQFASGASLRIGSPGSPATITAVGTAGTHDILFTGTGWKYLQLTADATSDSIVAHARFEGGGMNTGSIYCSGGSATLRDLEVDGSASPGIFLGASATPALEGTLTLTGSSGLLIDGVSQSVPVFNGTTLSSDTAETTAAIARGTPDFWASFANGGATVDAGSVNRLAEVMAGRLSESCSWGPSTGIDTWALVGDLTIADSAPTALTLEPDARLELGMGVDLIVGAFNQPGALIANGTAANPVVFTASGTNHAGSIFFTNQTLSSVSQLVHCQLTRLGNSGSDTTGAIGVVQASPQLTSLVITDSAKDGVQLVNTDAVLTDVRVVNFGLLAGSTAGITVSGNTGIPVIAGNGSIDGPSGDIGLELLSEATVSGLSIGSTTPVAGAAIEAASNVLPTFSQVALSPAASGVLGTGDADFWARLLDTATLSPVPFVQNVRGGTLTESATWGDPLEQATARIVLLDTLDVGSSSAPVLSVAPGTTVELPTNAVLRIGTVGPGGIVATGTAESPILFTDSDGSWGGLVFGGLAIDGSIRMDHCEIRSAGGAGNPALSLGGSRAVLNDVSVIDSLDSGVLVNGDARPQVVNLTIDGFASGGTGLTVTDSPHASIRGDVVIDGNGSGSTGCVFNEPFPPPDSPAIGNLTIRNITGQAFDGQTPNAAPTFESVTVDADVAKLGSGGADMWANIFNSDVTFSGSGWIQEVRSSNLTQDCTWGTQPAIDYVELPSALGGRFGVLAHLTLAPGTEIRTAGDILVGESIGGSYPLGLVGSLSADATIQNPVRIRGSGSALLKFGSEAESAQCVLRHVELGHSPDDQSGYITAPQLFLENATPTIDQVTSYGGPVAAVQVETLSADQSLTLRGLMVVDAEQGVVVNAITGNISILESTFNNSCTTAIVCTDDGALTLVESSMFTNCATGISVGANVGLLVANCQFDWPAAGESYESYTVHGVDSDLSAFPIFLDTVFAGTGAAVRIPAPGVHGLTAAVNANTLSGDTWVDVHGGTLPTITNWRVNGSGVFHVLGDIDYAVRVRFDPGVRLDLEPGVRIVPSTTSGTERLTVLGTVANPVVFASARTNQHWGGLTTGRFASIEHAVFERGGDNTDTRAAALRLKGRSTVRHTEIRDSKNYGLVQDAFGSAMGNPSTIDRCSITGSGADAIYCTAGTAIDVFHCELTGNDGWGLFTEDNGSSSPMLLTFANLRECRIAGNIAGGVSGTFAAAGSSSDARYCWWGSARGPGSPGPGTGDSVGAGIAYDPWFATDFPADHVTNAGANWLELAEVGPRVITPPGATRFYGQAPSGWDWSITVSDGVNDVFTSSGSTETIDVEWDGGGGADGTYTFTMATSGPINPQDQSTLAGTVVLATGAIVAKIDTPAPLDYLYRGTALNIVGSASGGTTYELSYGTGSEPDTFTLLGSGSATITDDLLGTLDLPHPLNPSNVPYITLKLTVFGSQGEEVTATRLVRYFTFFNLQIKPDPFSPDGDGFKDSTVVTGEVTWDSSWFLQVYPVSGQIVPILDTSAGPGTQLSFTWAPTTVPGEGDYRFEVEALPLGGGSRITQYKNVTVDFLDDDLITFVSHTDGDVVAGSPDVTVAIIDPGMDYLARVEFERAPDAWALLAEGNATTFAHTNTWDTTISSNGLRKLRAALFLADGTYYHSVITVNVANLAITPTNRVFDPIAGETTTISVTNGGIPVPGATLDLNVHPANTSADPAGIGQYTGKGSSVWSAASVPFETGSASIVWDGLNGATPHSAGEYVVSAQANYGGGVTASYDEPVISERTNSAIVSANLQGGSLVEFNPFLGENVGVDFELDRDAWVSVLYFLDKIAASKLLYAQGAHQFLWDGRQEYWVGLDLATQLAAADGGSFESEVAVLASQIPSSLMRLENSSIQILDVEVDPASIFPAYNQTAEIRFDVTGSPLVTVSVYEDQGDFGPATSLGSMELHVTDLDQGSGCGASHCYTFDPAALSTISGATRTYGILIEARNAMYPSYVTRVKRLVRVNL